MVTALPLSRHQVRQLLTFLLGKEAVLSPELYTFPRNMLAHPGFFPPYTQWGNSSPHPSSTTWAGQGHNPPGQAGKVIGTPKHSPTQPSQEVNSTSWEGNPTPIPLGRSNQGSSSEEPNPKWVINLSNKPFTPAQRSVLAKGPNFVVTPRQPPNLEYITAIESSLYQAKSAGRWGT